MTKYFIYGAVGVWAINFIWSAVIPVKDESFEKNGSEPDIIQKE